MARLPDFTMPRAGPGRRRLAVAPIAAQVSSSWSSARSSENAEPSDADRSSLCTGDLGVQVELAALVAAVGRDQQRQLHRAGGVVLLRGLTGPSW